MKQYLLSVDIIDKVLLGESLSSVFKNKLANANNLNIGKIKDISHGVIRYYQQLNIIFNQLVTENRCSKKIFIVVLIGIYELRYSKKEAHSIINFLVELSYTIDKNINIKKFVNAVLRNYIRKVSLIDKKFNDKLEFKYSIKDWWINRIKLDYPLQFQIILEQFNKIPKICLRVNNRKISQVEYISELEKNGIKYQNYDGKLVLTNNVSASQIPLLEDGYVSIQNVGAQKLLDFFTFENNMQVLDACCAPGSKLCQLLENYDIDVTGLDINQERITKVKQNLIRLGLNANIVVGDASNLKWWDGNKYDFIIADVPCSASGTIKKNPDIKINRTIEEIDKISQLQQKILTNLFKLLKVGGRLVYITCSIFKQENEDNILYFTQNNVNTKIIKELKILPDDYSDGFYYCLLEKTS
jgi:16S rRNA (cytosine967-C5)-methyltransferase